MLRALVVKTLVLAHAQPLVNHRALCKSPLILKPWFSIHKTKWEPTCKSELVLLLLEPPKGLEILGERLRKGWGGEGAAGNKKWAHLDIAIGIEEDVLQLEIPVDNPILKEGRGGSGGGQQGGPSLESEANTRRWGEGGTSRLGIPMVITGPSSPGQGTQSLIFPRPRAQNGVLPLLISLCDPGEIWNLSGPNQPQSPGTTPRSRAGRVGAHLVAIVHSRDNLPEEVTGLVLAEPLPLTDVVIQVAPAGVLHDDHNLAAVLKHWEEQDGTSGPS